VRRTLRERTVGHTGTLDPFASGLLVLLLARATRVARFFEGLRKTYFAVARLGVRTDTDDRMGTPLGESVETAHLSPQAVRSAVAAMVGEQSQRPPVYSAKRVGGVRSYRRARSGEAVQLPEVAITVYAADLLALEGGLVSFRVVVSSGTYVRALARDLGERLGVGGHLVELRREAIGTLTVDQAVPLTELRADTPILPLSRVLEHLPVVALNDREAAGVRHGRPLPARVEPGPGSGRHVALLADRSVLAIAVEEGETLRPIVVLEPA
jgi:tRNA pseudouridine55 synthase